MRCEVCGRKIYGKPVTAMIEGAKLTVCSECAKHGTIVVEKPKQASLTLKAKTTAAPPLKVPSTGKPLKNVDDTRELVEGYDAKIRQAREKLGLTHEELGKKINEKVSVLKKIETGKMIPDNKLAAKLEHMLKIKLLVPASEEKVSKAALPKSQSRELTLGDLVQIGEDKAEEKT
ncbi:MAG: multiprotein bridging factor aMBF1 [Candidatus Bathyarchaeales archaeon]